MPPGCASADMEVVATHLCRADAGWYNSGYIFPEGFKSRTLFRSSVAIDQLCVHECFIIGQGGEHWPGPTFKVHCRQAWLDHSTFAPTFIHRQNSTVPVSAGGSHGPPRRAARRQVLHWLLDGGEWHS